MTDCYLKKFITFSPEETIALGKKIGLLLKAGAVIALDGDLAAGKTTLTKGIAQGLHINQTITSPTFTIISEYAAPIPLFHFDVYRLSGGEDFINLGCDEMLYGKGVCVIEWSERIKNELPKHTIHIKINTNSDNSRTIQVRASRMSLNL